MFWLHSKKQKNASQTVKGSTSSKSAPLAVFDRGQSSHDIRQQALENARAARAHIGADKLKKISASMQADQSPKEQRNKDEIERHEAERIIAELLILIDEAR